MGSVNNKTISNKTISNKTINNHQYLIKLLTTNNNHNEHFKYII